MPNYDLEMAESVIAARDLKIDELTAALEQSQEFNAAYLARVLELEARIKEMHEDAPYDEETDSFIVDGMLLRALLYVEGS